MALCEPGQRLPPRLVPAGARVLDLGGGPGRATVALAAIGYRMTLVDLSPELVDAARAAITQAMLPVDDVLVGDAVAIPVHGPFDAVLCAGPPYHAGGIDELARTAHQTGTVLRPGGVALVTFMPRLAALAGLLARAGSRPDQVPPGTLTTTWRTGIYTNPTPDGFADGYFADPRELVSVVSVPHSATSGSSPFEVLVQPMAPRYAGFETSSPSCGRKRWP